VLRGKHILVGVTGGIAAYKVCYLVRDLRKAGAEVKVVMTEAAARFVTPLTFSALSGHDVLSDLWTHHQSTGSDIGTQHIALANWADTFVIAPASANTIAKLTYGLSDNLLTIVALASRCPIVLAPTMDADMYLNPVTQQNITKLQERGYVVVPPEEGELASGLKGPGRLPEIQVIIDTVERVIASSTQDLKEKKILVTAGPTYEAIDPVRFIGNRSSGKMGFALANAAALRGAAVTLVSGPVQLETPRNVTRIDVESAEQMPSPLTRSSWQQQWQTSHQRHQRRTRSRKTLRRSNSPFHSPALPIFSSPWVRKRRRELSWLDLRLRHRMSFTTRRRN
jgi:phosphopantothenoylcysteine decarboxylase/phosphopantothenate--cysteine ligase